MRLLFAREKRKHMQIGSTEDCFKIEQKLTFEVLFVVVSSDFKAQINPKVAKVTSFNLFIELE